MPDIKNRAQAVTARQPKQSRFWEWFNTTGEQ